MLTKQVRTANRNSAAQRATLHPICLLSQSRVRPATQISAKMDKVVRTTPARMWNIKQLRGARGTFVEALRHISHPRPAHNKANIERPEIQNHGEAPSLTHSTKTPKRLALWNSQIRYNRALSSALCDDGGACEPAGGRISSMWKSVIKHVSQRGTKRSIIEQ